MHASTPLTPTKSMWSRGLVRLGKEWQFALILIACYQLFMLVIGALVAEALPCKALTVESCIRQTTLLPWKHYDVDWYINIARNGYGEIPGDTAYHPLYPLLIHVVGSLLGGRYLLGGWLVSVVCCTCMLVLLYRLVQLDYSEAIAQRSVFLLMAGPLGFVFLIPYVESLFMVCSVGAFYAARKGRWWLAGCAGFCAALTKQPGVVLVLPLLIEWWLQERANLRDPKRRWEALKLGAFLGLVPLGLLVFVLFRASLGDIAFSWSNPSSLANAVLVTPQYRAVWDGFFGWPWVTFSLAVNMIMTRPNFYIIINTVLMLTSVAIIVLNCRRWRLSYALYALALMIMSLSLVHIQWPYMSIARRFTIVFPIFIQLAIWSGHARARLVVFSVCASLWVTIGVAYVLNAYIL